METAVDNDPSSVMANAVQPIDDIVNVVMHGDMAVC